MTDVAEHPVSTQQRQHAFESTWTMLNQRHDGRLLHKISDPDNGQLFVNSWPSDITISESEEKLATCLVRWLGSPAGIGFLSSALSQSGMAIVKTVTE